MILKRHGRGRRGEFSLAVSPIREAPPMSRSRRYSSRPRPRRHRSRSRLWSLPLAAGLAAAAAVAAAVAEHGGALAVRTAADSGSPLGASYQAVTSWGTGYTGQYTDHQRRRPAASGWTLAFRLPSGTSLSSLWNGLTWSAAAR